MFAPANRPAFIFELPGMEHDFQVVAFEGRDVLNQPYRFHLELVSERADWALDTLLRRPARLTFDDSGAGVQGLVAQVTQGDSGRRLTRYRIELVAPLALLAERVGTRIFQQRSVPQILAQLLEEHGLLAGAYRLALGPTPYPPRDYCVQYGESDLHFLNRLCEEEGIHYHHEQGPEGAVLVFGDDATAFATLAATSYLPGNGQVAEQPVVLGFQVGVQARTTQVTLRDYDPAQPRLRLEARSQGDAATNEHYGFPGRFTHRERGARLAGRRLEALRVAAQDAAGHGDQPALAAGHLLPLAEHPCAAWNTLWLLTAVEHQGRQPQVLEEGLETAALLDLTDAPLAFHGYRNRFSAMPADIAYRPASRHPKPRLLGQQSAVVTGPAGEDIHCDALGRIKVQFHWDREGQANEHSSAWLRLATGWAGARHGALAVPRIGMEVLVGFLEGDPDQPLVMGSLYHADHRPPLDLPRDKTRSTFKSQSTPGGGGYNELRIEDRQGQEQIHLHAQRDWREHIRHDHRSEIDQQRHQHIHGNSHSELHAEEHRLTQGARQTEAKLNDHLTVSGSQHLKLGGGQFVEAGGEIHLKAGDRLVIEAGSEISLSAGGSFITLNPGGITLKGPLARLNAGGNPASGSGIAVALPTPPGSVPSGSAGEPNQRALANQPQDEEQNPQRRLDFSL